MIGFVVLVALSSYLAPQLTRRDIFFGVTVSPGFRDSPAARSVSRRYAMEVWGLAFVAAVLVGTSPMPVIPGQCFSHRRLAGSSRSREPARLYVLTRLHQRPSARRRSVRASSYPVDSLASWARF